MKNKTVSLNGHSFSVTYPENFIISHSPDSYIRVHTTDGYIGPVSLRFQMEDLDGIDITREITENGYAVFPIADIMDYMADGIDGNIAKNVLITLIVNTDNADINIISALVGATDVPIVPIKDDATMTTAVSNVPFPKKLVVYDNGPEDCINVPIFFPKKDNANVLIRADYRDDFETITTRYGGSGKIYIDINYIRGQDNVSDFNVMLYATEFISPATPSIKTNIHVDSCSQGIFTRWIDRHGFEFYFRWDIEKTTEDVTNIDSYIAFSDTLDPYNIDTKSSQTLYALHSGAIEREVFDYVSSILSAQKVEYFNSDLDRWCPCQIEETEIEDNGDDYKDLGIIIIKNNRTVL